MGRDIRFRVALPTSTGSFGRDLLELQVGSLPDRQTSAFTRGRAYLSTLMPGWQWSSHHPPN
jgi:hypothetical protein